MEFWLCCRACGKRIVFTIHLPKCQCGGTFAVEYDLEKIRSSLTKDEIKNRNASMWRYAELLPLENRNNIISLGEGWTPLIRMQALENIYPVKKLWVKKEDQNPTGSFKARGFSAAISIAKEHGIKKVAVNSNGNAASALAAYASRADMKAYVFIPKDCPGLIAEECRNFGGHTFFVDGLIHDAGKIIEDGKSVQDWHHVGTLKEPGRVEGKKTMGFELAEQLNWRLPDVIVYPTGGGSGIIGMWNAFHQLREIGLIEGDFPRIVSVQEAGCDPITQSLESGCAFNPQTGDIHSTPTGMRVPNPPDGDWILSVLKESNGTSITVTKEEIEESQSFYGRQGISSSPEGAATWAGFVRLMDQGWIRPTEEVVLFNTSHAMKYLEWEARNIPVVKTYKDFCSLGHC